MNAYLCKPFDPEELVSIVDSVIFNNLKATAVPAEETGQLVKSVPVDGQGDSTGEVDDPGENSGVLEDVRR